MSPHISVDSANALVRLEYVAKAEYAFVSQYGSIKQTAAAVTTNAKTSI
jgi:hypothetical protein